MDVTARTRGEVSRIISKLERRWLGRDYDLLSHNCCHFCATLCEELGVATLPAWITNLAVTGASLLTSVRSMVAAGRETALAVSEAAREVDGRVRDLVGLALPLEQSSGGEASEFGGLAWKLLAGVSGHLWPEPTRGRGEKRRDMVDVVLECIYSSAVDVSTLQQWQLCIAKRIERSQPWVVGPSLQPDSFSYFMPDLSQLPEELRSDLFELSWEPPCLVLRKPCHSVHITVGGMPVRQLSYVLLSNIDISLCKEEGGTPLLTFRALRYSEWHQGPSGPRAVVTSRAAIRCTSPMVPGSPSRSDGQSSTAEMQLESLVGTI
mmetsp:Transcript_31131/g.72274  ORF Transcript_31131/g.72274 Transcript_31131/m.72274 type:complete len:321 (+) Transcript_31131:191-1153(+)